MSANDNGGPAFPRPAGDYNGTRGGNGAQAGMTLRDYFAAKAMQGLLAANWCVELRELSPNSMGEREVASDAYIMADAMLAERLKVKP